jgi:hypothetical protein
MFKFDFQDSKNEETKLRETIRNKEKTLGSLNTEYENISNKAEEAKKKFQENLSLYKNVKQSNEQMKKLICMMIVNKK